MSFIFSLRAVAKSQTRSGVRGSDNSAGKDRTDALLRKPENVKVEREREAGTFSGKIIVTGGHGSEASPQR